MIDLLKAMGVFAKTAECGSFRDAARQLGLSPSVVSHHIAELERRHDTVLLYRSTRRIALTPKGQELYEAARDMLAAAERGLDALTGESSNPSGRLRVTAPAMLAETRFCRDVAQFVETYPAVSLAFSFTDRMLDLIRDGLDVAVRIGWPEDSGLTARRLSAMPRVLVAAPAYANAQGQPDGIEALAGWHWLHLSALRPEAAFLDPGGEIRSVRYEPRLSVDSAAALRRFAQEGLGLAALPEVLVRDDLMAGRLVEVAGRWRLPEPGVYAVWPGPASRSGITARFVDFIDQRLKTLFRPRAAP